jgi:hypothetical protein
MIFLYSIFATLNGRAYPLFAFLILLLIVIYQLFSGRLLNGYWRVWITREGRPKMYWSILAIEFVFVMIGLCLFAIR